MSLPNRGALRDELTYILKHYHHLDTEAPHLSRLRLYRQLYLHGVSHIGALRTIVVRLLDELKTLQPGLGELLTRRYLDDDTAESVARSRGMSESSLFALQNKAFDEMTRLLAVAEGEARLHHQRHLCLRAPFLASQQLVGIEAQASRLATVLADPDDRRLVAVTGMGGIGKTTLACATLLYTVQQNLWDNVAWVIAQPSLLDSPLAARTWQPPPLTTLRFLNTLYDQLLPASTRPSHPTGDHVFDAVSDYLRRARCLIVIDNLESVAEMEPLLPMLRQFGGNGRYLLTCGEKLVTTTDVLDVPIRDLDEGNAIRVLRNAVGTILDAHNVSDDDLRPVYAAVGGNPLALRLVAGQLHIYGLADIVADLREVRSTHVEAMYTYIYRRTWDGLAPIERHVLLSMAAVAPSGATLDEIRTLVGLSERDVYDALRRLVTCCLVELRGDVRDTRCYAIHSLTRSFLAEQVLRWHTPGVLR